MEKWKEYIREYPELEKRWNNIPEATNTLFCGQIDMYARNLSIEFAEWCSSNNYHNYAFNKSKWHKLDGVDYTTAQLFTIFLNERFK